MTPGFSKAEYDSKGYVIARQLIPIEEVNAILDDMTAVFQGCVGSSPVREPGVPLNELMRSLFRDDFARYHGAAKLCNHLIPLHRLGLSSRVVSILKGLGLSFPTICARPVVWFHSRHLAKTERYYKLPAHQEWSNMQGSLDGVVAWAPLVDIPVEMGRLQVIPGSHKRGLLKFDKDLKNDYPLAMDMSLIDESEFVSVDVGVGDVLFFSSFLVHRSGVNHTDDARLTVNFRYNNALEPTFIARDFLNPYLYQVADKLFTNDFPTVDEVQGVFGCN